MADLNTNFPQFEEFSADVVRVRTLKEAFEKELEVLEEKIDHLEVEVSVLERVSDLFRILIDKEVVDNAKTAEALLTEGLQAIFDDIDLSVKTLVDVHRGKVSVELVTVQTENDGTQTEGCSTDAYGGSVSTIQSVLLRIVVLTRRGLRPILLLDESLAAVAERYVPRVGMFLSVLSSRMGLDVLAVSHNPALVEAAQTAYRIKKKNGEASLKKLKRGFV